MSGCARCVRSPIGVKDSGLIGQDLGVGNEDWNEEVMRLEAMEPIMELETRDTKIKEGLK